VAERKLSELASLFPEVQMSLLDSHPADTPEIVEHYLQRSGMSFSVRYDPSALFQRGMQVRYTTTALFWDGRQWCFSGHIQDLENALRQWSQGESVAPMVTPQSGCSVNLFNWPY
jgi:hypothetical protein